MRGQSWRDRAVGTYVTMSQSETASMSEAMAAINFLVGFEQIQLKVYQGGVIVQQRDCAISEMNASTQKSKGEPLCA